MANSTSFDSVMTRGTSGVGSDGIGWTPPATETGSDFTSNLGSVWFVGRDVGGKRWSGYSWFDLTDLPGAIEVSGVSISWRWWFGPKVSSSPVYSSGPEWTFFLGRDTISQDQQLILSHLNDVATNGVTSQDWTVPGSPTGNAVETVSMPTSWVSTSAFFHEVEVKDISVYTSGSEYYVMKCDPSFEPVYATVEWDLIPDSLSLVASALPLTVAPGGVTSELNAATATIGLQSATVIPGAVSNSLAPAIAASNGLALTVVPGGVTKLLSAAAAATSAPTITLGLVNTIPLATATLAADPGSVSVSPGPTVVQVSSMSAAISAEDMTTIPGPVAVVLTAATAEIAGQIADLLPGNAIVMLDPATIAISASEVTALAGSEFVFTGTCPVEGSEIRTRSIQGSEIRIRTIDGSEIRIRSIGGSSGCS